MSDTDLLIVAMIVVGIMIAIGLYRVYAGPTVFDRLVAIALVSVNGVVVLVLLGMTFGRAPYFLDIALGFALLAFLLPIALGRYFEERDDGTSRDGLPSAAQRPQPKGIVPHGLYAERARVQQQRERARRSGSAHGEEASEAAAGGQRGSTSTSGAGRSTRSSRRRIPEAPGYAGPGGAGPQGPSRAAGTGPDAADVTQAPDAPDEARPDDADTDRPDAGDTHRDREPGDDAGGRP